MDHWTLHVDEPIEKELLVDVRSDFRATDGYVDRRVLEAVDWGGQHRARRLYPTCADLDVCRYHLAARIGAVGHATRGPAPVARTLVRDEQDEWGLASLVAELRRHRGNLTRARAAVGLSRA